MDDPWGSPWASSETTSKHGPPTPSPPKDLLSPPPRAFFGSTSNLQSQSPWANDNGFGDWAGAEQADTTTNSLDWGVWAEPSAQLSHSSLRPDELFKSSITLPSSTATSPGLRPLPRSRSSSVFRHHSPDPWTAEVPLQDMKNDSPIVNSNALGIAAIDVDDQQIETPIPSAQKQDVIQILEASAEDTRSNEEGDKTLVNGLKSQEPLPSSLAPRESHDSARDSIPKVEIHDILSRSSSTFSVDSTNEVERQDSPITSIDEDPKSRGKTTSQKASNKVQELVGMYDDLAKTIIEEPSPPTRLDPPRTASRGRSPSQTRSVGTGDDGDFGDFEDAKSECDNPTSEPNISVTPSGSSSTPRAQIKDASIEDETQKSIEHEPVVPGIPSTSVQQIVDKFGAIQFDVDFQLVDKLFSDIPDDANDETNESSGIPDRIVEDSFTTISERKTWYRISRYGSMRKHDFGDEDNYHRVEWASSNIHSDTIKIVRRWMEEDSIAGRATLGAGNRTSVFNWDSSAAPVDLGEVFARKPSITHSRKSSTQSSNQTHRQSMQSVGSGYETRSSIKSPIQPPDATPGRKAITSPGFGWSSGSIKSPPMARAFPSNDEGSEHVNPISRAAVATIKTEARTHATAVHTPTRLNQTQITLDDEDDDWGEMVSSPRVETQPGPALTTQPLTSLNSAISTTPVNLSNGIPKDNVNNVDPTESNNSAPKLSVFIPQTQTAKHVPSQTGSFSAASRVDPWPLADFSIFESLSAQTPRSTRQDPWPLADFSAFESPTSGSVSNSLTSLKSKPKTKSKPREINSARASMDQVIETNIPLKAILGPIQKSSQEQNHDDIVKSIIQNLPDLSYMLR
ncbi:hypothetical protein F4804DRAFT_53668 [Jackrogersella minutella]|nr:hypothetical protein F4804DRAFT_53668 [Jackrogersella minutella]